MTYGFKITGLSLAVLVLGFGPAGAGSGDKQAGTDSDIKSGTSVEMRSDSPNGGISGDGNAGVSGGAVIPGAPSTGGSLETDTSVHGQVDGRLKHPDPPEQPSASPRMDTEPSARDRLSPELNRSGDPAQRPDETRSPRSGDTLNRPDPQSPRSDRSPGEPQQPPRSYKQ